MSDDRFQIGEYYLVKHPNSPVYKAGWYDAQTGQTRRASLGTKDLQDAKKALAEFVIKQAQPKHEKTAEMPLALVLVRYWEAHASKIASAEAAEIALALWTEFWGAAMVDELTVPRQFEFIEWLKARGYKNAYVSRIMSVGRAAINRAYKWGEIDRAPFIHDETDRSDAKEPYVLNPGEMRRFLTKAQEIPHLFVYCMIALNTLARPDAVLDLAPPQVNLKDRRISLNPQGRKQTKKFRPIVPITDTLLPFVQEIERPRFVTWHGKAIDRIDGSFGRTVEAAYLPSDISPYSLRHTMATELRRRGVPPWEVEGLLGHRRPGVTEKYAHFAPDYLSEGRAAIDAYFAELSISYTVPDLDNVSVACQSPETKKSAEADYSTFTGVRMVGVTGIEPVTPTMST